VSYPASYNIRSDFIQSLQATKYTVNSGVALKKINLSSLLKKEQIFSTSKTESHTHTHTKIPFTRSVIMPKITNDSKSKLMLG
jgi:predicted glycosyltransferase